LNEDATMSKIVKYRLTLNGRLAGDYSDKEAAKERARFLENKILEWRESDNGWFAMGQGDLLRRNEYEIVPVKKKRA
jgi:hypothetical protein